MMPGTLQFAPISFYPDLGMRGGVAIALGVFAELLIPGRLRGLGLIARTELTDREILHLDAIGKRMLANPFDFLCREFEEAWEASPRGGAISYLSRKHCHSLRLEEQGAKQLPRSLWQAGQPVKQLVREHLSKMLEDTGAELLSELPDAVPEVDASRLTGTKEITTPLPLAA
jgi:hypothetical protein